MFSQFRTVSFAVVLLLSVTCSRAGTSFNAYPAAYSAGRVPKLTMKLMREELGSGLRVLYSQYNRFASMYVELEEHKRIARDYGEESGVELWGLVAKLLHEAVTTPQRANETNTVIRSLHT